MKSFYDFVDSLKTNSIIKSEITDESFISKHGFYLNLVDYLLPAFSGINKNDEERFALSSYLYFRFVVFFDHFLDESKSKDRINAYTFDRLFVAFEFYEKSLRDLSTLFKDGDRFWDSFTTLKKEYFESMIRELEFSATKKPITEKDFEQLASGKSIICNACVYGLASLSNDDSSTSLLLECIKEIHISSQYIDDIEDFKKDIEEGQWTYIRQLIQEYLEKNRLEVKDASTLQKHLYLSGIATYCIERAIHHAEISSSIANELGLDKLADFLGKKKQSFQDYRKVVDSVIQKTKIKSLKPTQFWLNQSINKGIGAGVDYLVRNFEDNQCWSDFLTSAGFGRSWITAYVGFQLSEIDPNSTILKLALEKLNSEKSNSYNDSVVSDGDSTTFKMGFSKRMKQTLPVREIEEWMSYMNNDGGWVTYRDEKGLTLKLGLELERHSLRHWMTSKLCVSASTAYVLSFFDELRNEYNLTCKYLINHRSNENNWDSYWWTSSIYATSFAVMALSADSRLKHHAIDGAKWLKNQQYEKGYWMNELTNESSPFYSSLALKALLLFDPIKYEVEIKIGINWLLQNQIIDGSWLTNRILKIPDPKEEFPTAIKDWRRSSLGINCIVDDHNRVFTTSTVVNTLAEFSRIFHSDIDKTNQYKANAEKPITIE